MPLCAARQKMNKSTADNRAGNHMCKGFKSLGSPWLVGVFSRLLVNSTARKWSFYSPLARKKALLQKIARPEGEICFLNGLAGQSYFQKTAVSNRQLANPTLKKYDKRHGDRLRLPPALANPTPPKYDKRHGARQPVV